MPTGQWTAYVPESGQCNTCGKWLYKDERFRKHFHAEEPYYDFSPAKRYCLGIYCKTCYDALPKPPGRRKRDPEAEALAHREGISYHTAKMRLFRNRSN